MNELIKITETDGKQSVSARELHEKLGVKTQFNHWIKRMIEYGFIENQDFTVVKNDYGKNDKGQFTSIEYCLSIGMAKEICMIQRSEIGKKFRQYFIECERVARQVTMNTPQIEVLKQQNRIATFDRLHSLANEYEGKSETYKQVLDAHATKELTGEFLLPLPLVIKKTYSATEIGNMLGISARKVGQIANENNLKVKDYGEWYKDKAKGSNKEVDTFRYYEEIIPILKSKIA